MIKIMQPGLFSTIQDNGRDGYRNIGIPCSGFMDKESANAANTIVGNHKNESLIEFTLKGPVLLFNNSYSISITGGDFTPLINGHKVEMYFPLKVKLGDTLELSHTKNGARGYLAIRGGIKSENIFGSKSFSKSITNTSVLEKGDEIFISSNILTKPIKKHNFKYTQNNLLNVFKGPEFNLLSKDTIAQIFQSDFILGVNNRMAYNIKDKIKSGLSSIISSPVLPGTIQLTPSGNIIILHRECQTSGGYSRILQLDKNSLNCLSQLSVGQKTNFNLINVNT